MEKQFWVDFAEGRIDVPGMLAETEKRPELLDWLTGIAGPEFKTVVVHRGTDENGYPTFTPEELAFDAKMSIRIEIREGQGGMLGRYLNIHSMFSQILMTAFPEDGAVGVVSFVTFSHKVGPQLLVVKTCAGQIGQQAAECDATQQQGLKFFHDGKVQQGTGDDDHHQILPAAFCQKTGEDSGKTAVIPQLQKDFTNINTHSGPP